MIDEALNFEKLFTRSLIQGLEKFGKSASQAILFHIENKYGVRVEDIIHQPEVFHEALMDIFPFGWEIIERQILKVLYQEIGEELGPCKGVTFKEVIENAYITFKEILKERMERKLEKVGVSGIAHRFGAILEYRDRVVAVDHGSDYSSIIILSIKMKDCNIEEGILLIDSQPDENMRKIASRYNIHIVQKMEGIEESYV